MGQDYRPSFLMSLSPIMQPHPHSESDTMGFAANAQQIAGGSLEGLQVQKRILSSCRWETWWGLFKAAPLGPCLGPTLPPQPQAMSPGISLPRLLLQAFTGSPVSCCFLVPRLWGEDLVRPGGEGGGRKRLIWNKLKSLLCAALK